MVERPHRRIGVLERVERRRNAGIVLKPQLVMGRRAEAKGVQHRVRDTLRPLGALDRFRRVEGHVGPERATCIPACRRGDLDQVWRDHVDLASRYPSPAAVELRDPLDKLFALSAAWEGTNADTQRIGRCRGVGQRRQRNGQRCPACHAAPRHQTCADFHHTNMQRQRRLILFVSKHRPRSPNYQNSNYESFSGSRVSCGRRHR